MIYDVIIKGDLFRPYYLKSAPNDGSNGGSNSIASSLFNGLGAGVISGVGSLLNGLLGNSAQSSANETNLKIAQQNVDLQRETNQLNRQLAEMANAQNYRMFREQNEFNVDMWNKQNAYNAPSAQVERLKAAGINPAAVLGSIGTGNMASSLSSAPSSPAERANMVAPQLNYHAEPLPSPLAGVPDAMNAFISNRLANAQIRNIESQASMNEVKADLERQSFENSLLDRLNNARRGSLEYEKASEDLKLWRETRDFEYRLRKSSAEMGEGSVLEAQERIATAKVEREILRSNAVWQDRLNAASYQSLLAGIRQAISAANMNDASAVESAARTAVAKASEEGLRLDNKQKDELRNLIISKAREEVYLMEDERAMRPYIYSHKMQGKAGEFIPNPAGVYGASELYERNHKRDRLKR